jgi:preprotein translocase SecE subunit
VGLLKKNMDTVRNIITELKQTNWPTMRQLFKLTLYTIIVTAIVALIILGLDLVFFQLRDLILDL